MILVEKETFMCFFSSNAGSWTSKPRNLLRCRHCTVQSVQHAFSTYGWLASPVLYQSEVISCGHAFFCSVLRICVHVDTTPTLSLSFSLVRAHTHTHAQAKRVSDAQKKYKGSSRISQGRQPRVEAFPYGASVIPGNVHSTCA